MYCTFSQCSFSPCLPSGGLCLIHGGISQVMELLLSQKKLNIEPTDLMGLYCDQGAKCCICGIHLTMSLSDKSLDVIQLVPRLRKHEPLSLCCTFCRIIFEAYGSTLTFSVLKSMFSLPSSTKPRTEKHILHAQTGYSTSRVRNLSLKQHSRCAKTNLPFCLCGTRCPYRPVLIKKDSSSADTSNNNKLVVLALFSLNYPQDITLQMLNRRTVAFGLRPLPIQDTSEAPSNVTTFLDSCKYCLLQFPTREMSGGARGGCKPCARKYDRKSRARAKNRKPRTATKICRNILCSNEVTNHRREYCTPICSQLGLKHYKKHYMRTRNAGKFTTRQEQLCRADKERARLRPGELPVPCSKCGGPKTPRELNRRGWCYTCARADSKRKKLFIKNVPNRCTKCPLCKNLHPRLDRIGHSSLSRRKLCMDCRTWLHTHVPTGSFVCPDCRAISFHERPTSTKQYLCVSCESQYDCKMALSSRPPASKRRRVSA